MTDDTAQPPQPVSEPVSSLDDPPVVQMLSSEHASLASARSLAYNEAFTRGDTILYGLLSSGGMIGLIVSMLGGVLALMAGLILGLSLLVGSVIAALVAMAIFIALVAGTIRFYSRVQARLDVAFPTPTNPTKRKDRHV